MMLHRAPPSNWRQPAHAVRRMLGRVLRRPEFDQPQPSGNIGSLAPSVEDAPGLIRQRIEALHATNALDEGTDPVLDRTIASWVDQWSARVEQQHRTNQARLQRRSIEVSAERDRIRAELKLLDDELDAVDRYIARHPQQPSTPREERPQT
jgi:hypothetical protein